MSNYDYINWKNNTKEKIRAEHPDWSECQVNMELGQIDIQLRKQGYFA